MSVIDEIYARVPDVHCKGLCQECCGPISMSRAEAGRIHERHGFVPGAPVQDPVVAAQVEFRSRSKPLGKEEVSALFTCNALIDGKCSVYADRPLICRLFAATKKMSCPYGCRPKKFVPDEKVAKWIHRLDRL